MTSPKAKTCGVCRELLPAASFHSHATRGDGLQYACKDCGKWGHIKRTFGLSRKDWLALRDSQGGLCAICAHEVDIEPKRSYPGALVDHDHRTGAIRGILCSWCNSRLGWLEKHEEQIQAYRSTR